MKHLSQYQPAQTLMLIDSDCSLKELVKVTFMDLLFRQVLQANSVTSQPHPLTSAYTSTYISQGINFKNYLSKPYEEVFTAPFIGHAGLEVLFRHLVKMGYQNSGSRGKYKRLIIQELEGAGLAERTWWNHLFGGCELTSVGEEVSKKLKEELKLLKETLPGLIKENPEQAGAVLEAIKGNVFLISGFDVELLRRFDQELNKPAASVTNSVDTSDVAAGCWIWHWHLFEECSESFDSSCGGDAGCSGDGDSGCSGGGCSGCGGD
ncbi:hypothetical protein [Cesiribacter sp. SM1]|uniref:hypothetical protein n=1 Tax=Cesiribacter sp. SM1 TaxID=2861196 RepID=UPI001CD1A7AC|nr:hypothetical protein [Cesiribacter sp. SM1]